MFINVYKDDRGLWTSALCKGRREIESLGGSYPNTMSAKLDGQNKWGRGLEVKISYSPMFVSNEKRDRIIDLIGSGADSSDIAEIVDVKVSIIRAMRAHFTMGNYFNEGA
jgi:hypothetical protein